MIQDYILGFGTWVLITALVPTLISKEKPPLVTCIMIGVTLAVFSITMYTIPLTFAATNTAVEASLWMFIIWRKYRQLRIDNPSIPWYTFFKIK